MPTSSERSLPISDTGLRKVLTRTRRQSLKPPPRLDLVEWADAHRYVSKKNSANPGRWRTDRVPVAYGPMLAVTEPDTTIVTVEACTQLVKTEFLLNCCGYFIHQDPSAILFMQPTQKLAEDFSKERFAPTRSETPVLKALVPDAKSRGTGVTITHKEYPGGSLDFVGANAPGDLASRPKRITLADEIDKYPPSAGVEGDPLALGEERSSTFWNRKNIRACSPTDELGSRIHAEYLLSDQRRCFVPCPHCGTRQVLVWSRESVQWDKDPDGNHLPGTVRYYCAACGVGWSEAERIRAVRDILDLPDRGWRQTKRFRCCGREHEPTIWDDRGRSRCPECGGSSAYDGHAGFTVSKLYSTRHRLSDVVKEYLSSYRRPEKYKKFVNTALAEVTKDEVERTDPEALKARVEPYDSESLPARIKFVTFGADLHADRLEITFIGWATEEEAFVAKHEVVAGDPRKRDVWSALDHVILTPLRTEDGRTLHAQAGCIDSQGVAGSLVHEFCRARRRRRIYPTKGAGNDPRGSRLIWPKTPSRTKNSGEKVYVIGVDTAKDDLAGRLPIQPDPSGAPVPRCMHFPASGLSADYFEQLTAEQAVTKWTGNRPVRGWQPKEKGARNEALDCAVGALAARLSLPIKLSRPARARRKAGTSSASPPHPPPSAAPSPQREGNIGGGRKPTWRDLGSRMNR